MEFLDPIVRELFDNIKTKFEAFYIPTKRANRRLACLYFPCENAKYTILFAHDVDDLGLTSEFLVKLSKTLECNILSYDYAGYGVSTGKSTEKNWYADIEAVYDAMKKR